MALAAQQQTQGNWTRWPQQIPQSFPIMSSSEFMPYDPRVQASSQMQRQMSSQYLMDSNYNQPPMPTDSSPQYQHPSAFSYMAYQSPPPSTPLGSPFKTEFPEHQLARYQPYSPISRRGSVSSTATRSSTGPGTPSSAASSPDSLSPATPAPLVASQVINSKTLIYNETIRPADKIDFRTEVDELMKAIQKTQTTDECQQTLTPVQTPKAGASDAPVLRTQGGKPKKLWFCDGPNCGKAFVQKTHRDIHRRTHTGQRPYVCDKPNCGLTFSQRGNLKTHIRRHTGEKPFACKKCGKSFAQRGNLRSHEETHKGLKPFICRLDDCNKSFSQLGNMKTHQNNFHKSTLQKLTQMFAQFSESSEVPDNYHDLFEYFQQHYKNSNKGIKGRGKTRAVAARGPQDAAYGNAKSPVTTQPKTPATVQMAQMVMPAQDLRMPHGRPPPYVTPQGSVSTLNLVLRNPIASFDHYGPTSPPTIYEMGLSKWGPENAYTKNH
ncbi:uncharacterized protein TRIVIDRAFT_140226 [Trichoderma virens Gv29-8]|uniref:C2H2-type domain-containing protein n=1 Tax=Hypocrea virens (strain Gv29-8 / FGSC 10586) TaxID=413071 RepID=G9MDU7_HYPVG|nr:uncharacterized protein TRIVIDRAFT_140226 [Trichoderma virens Gv29-8]EHK27256.1 hypothetical protein TRIVIDRAFT_140226 [Trichoderma virens Gv29-8]